jgi:hypothetical protein
VPAAQNHAGLGPEAARQDRCCPGGERARHGFRSRSGQPGRRSSGRLCPTASWCGVSRSLGFFLGREVGSVG